MVVDLAAYRRQKTAEKRKREFARLVLGSDDDRSVAIVSEVLHDMGLGALDVRLGEATGLDWRSGL